MILRFCVLCVSFLITVPAMANPPLMPRLHVENLDQIEQIDPAQEAIKQLVDLSGITGLSLQARNIAQKALNDLNASVGQQYDVVDRVSAKWSPMYLQTQLEGTLKRHSFEQNQMLLATMNDRYIQLAREKELSAIQDQSTAVFRDYIQRLRMQPPAQERVMRIQELDRAMYFSAFMLKTREQVYPHIRSVMNTFKAPDNWETKLRSDVLEFLLFVHRGTSNDELQRMINLYKEPHMQSFLKNVYGQLGS